MQMLLFKPELYILFAGPICTELKPAFPFQTGLSGQTSTINSKYKHTIFLDT